MVHSTKKRREKLNWYFTVDTPLGKERRRSFIRDPMNDNRKQAIVNDQVKSIEGKGVVADARGKMWVIDRPDQESPAAQTSLMMV